MAKDDRQNEARRRFLELKRAEQVSFAVPLLPCRRRPLSRFFSFRRGPPSPSVPLFLVRRRPPSSVVVLRCPLSPAGLMF